MHFETRDKLAVRPSNRVCIYSPRFAAVRHVGGHFEEKLALNANSANVPVPPQTQTQIDPALLSIERIPIKGELQYLTPTAFKERTPGTEIKLAASILEALKGISPQINFEVLRTGVMTDDQRALIAEHTAKTTILTDGQSATSYDRRAASGRTDSHHDSGSGLPIRLARSTEDSLDQACVARAWLARRGD